MSLLPREIVDRVARVQDYHAATKYTSDSVRAEGLVLDWENQPSTTRLFGNAPKIPLPTLLLDAAAFALPVLGEGIAAVPPSQLNPPQDLRTLATWLYLSAGQTAELQAGGVRFELRACPSMAALYPCEIYVAAFAIAGLEPGLYHFSVREFALRKLRGGQETLAQIKRGRPELAFLKSVPATLLVSTIFWRSAWRYRQRAYRVCLLDAGHLVQNLTLVGNALGIATLPRLWMNDKSMHDLIGIDPSADFGAAEAVHAMVTWADRATAPMTVDREPAAPLLPIARHSLSRAYVPYGSILAVHLDCTAPGMPLREIGTPITNSSALPDQEAGIEFPPSPTDVGGPTVRQVMQGRRSAPDFRQNAISREKLLIMNRLAFRTGTFNPIRPEGPHIGLVRPFWIVNDVIGMEAGVWLYHPPLDRWWLMHRGVVRAEARYLAAEQPPAGNAAAVCFLLANLGYLMANAGPDAYRLTHLEAGLAGQRLALSAASLGLGARGLGAFYDDDVRTFLKLAKTRWEPIFAVAIGNPAEASAIVQLPAVEAGWRGDI